MSLLLKGKSIGQDYILPPEILDLIPSIIDKWIYEIFFNGAGLDEKALRKGVAYLYASCRAAMPDIMICDSPTACQIAANKAASEADYYSMPAIESQLWHDILLKYELYPIVWDSPWTPAALRLSGEVHMYEQIVYLSAIRTVILNRTEKIIRSSNNKFYRFSEDNLLFRAKEIASYKILSAAGIIKSKSFDKYIALLQSGCFLSLFFNGLAIICRCPTTFKINSNGALHCDGGPALEWKNGDAQYYLNGVMVSSELALTPANELDPVMVLKEKNVEVRREMVRKIGAERLIQRLGGQVIHSWNGYQLIRLEIPGMRVRPTYLKMQNPSIGVYHVEGVPPRIRTCQQALAWRTGGLKWKPEQLT